MDSHANLASPSTQLILGGGGRGAMVFVYIVNSSPLLNTPLLQLEMANGSKVTCHHSQNSEIPFPQGLQVKPECEHKLEFQTQGHCYRWINHMSASVPSGSLGWFFEPPGPVNLHFPQVCQRLGKRLELMMDGAQPGVVKLM